VLVVPEIGDVGPEDGLRHIGIALN
jgi:hypothetical protein